MGRFRRFPVEGGGRPRRKASMGEHQKIDMAIERRLGHLDPICSHCGKRNRRGSTKCVSCGHSGEMRRSAKHPHNSVRGEHFRGKGTNSSGF